MLQKQWRRAVAALCCLAALGALTEHPLAIGTSAQSAILIEASSGRALYEQNPDQQMLIASTTKIMTAIVALESCALDERVEITQAHMVEGSSMYLKPGETLTMEELLYGLMLCSGNDAALAVADHCGPGVEAFVEKMNDKAADLGMTNTSFANPNGLECRHPLFHGPGYGGPGGLRHAERDLCAHRFHGAHHHRRPDHGQPQQAAGRL